MIDPRFFEKAASGQPAPSTEGGASGYFSRPEPMLDPNLFENGRLREKVRNHLLGTLVNWLDETMAAHEMQSWLHVWLAGSGISYQWAASRGNGDLDVLFGVNLGKFQAANHGWDWSEAETAAQVNDGMKEGLWPSTAQTRFGFGTYEVTYFWNPGTGSDIKKIHPYAAYDLVKDKWAVPPPQLPEIPGELYPQDWYIQAGKDSEAALRLTRAFNEHIQKYSDAMPGSMTQHNSGAALNGIVAEANNLFTDMHTGRRAAFSDQGRGYGDYANFRWQFNKLNGAVQALSQIANVGKEARRQQETEQWGAPIDGAEIALRRAVQQYRGRL